MSALPTAIQIPELLEQVLLSLPVKQILVVQAVCRNWLACIQESIKIQQALFFQSRTERSIHLIRDKAQLDADEWTPEMEVGHWSYAAGSNQILKPTINPLVPEVSLTEFPDYVAFIHYGFIEERFDPQREHDKGIARSGPQSPERMAILHRPNASWRSMLVMQPASTEISIRCKGQYLPVVNRKGVTLQDILTAVRGHYEKTQCFSSRHWIECWDVEGFTSKEVCLPNDGLVMRLSASGVLAHMNALQ